MMYKYEISQNVQFFIRNKKNKFVCFECHHI